MHLLTRMTMTASRPLPYTSQVAWLQCDNRVSSAAVEAYIDLGFHADATTRWVCDATFSNFGVTAGCMGQGGARFCFGRGSASWSDWYCGWGTQNYRSGKSHNNSRHTFEINGPTAKFYVDSSSFSLPTTTWNTGTAHLCLFARGQDGGGVMSDNAKVTFFSSKIWRGGVLTHDLIPVRVGTVGAVYNKVDGQLLYNANPSSTNRFTVGGDVR